MKDFKVKYERLSDEFETYQSFAESQIQMLNEKNIELSKSLDALANIVEISRYINSNLSDDNLIPMINDMIIGILGVTYSSIYLIEKGDFVIKATNLPSENMAYTEHNYLDKIDKKNAFVLNSRESIFKDSRENIADIHSLIGVPIKLRDKFIGYIIIEHTLWNYFSYEHVTFVTSIANQIAIAIENNFLYKRIQESAKKDSLLDIYNRKYLRTFVDGKIKDNSSFALVMMDFDDFKQFNDSYGHLYGDEILVNTIELIKSRLSSKDLIARYGGEEVVIFLNRENNEDLRSFVESIREDVCSNVISLNGISKNTTASFGVSYYPEDGGTLNGVLDKADNCLYLAKEKGKNRVVTTKDENP
ncbi:sensor domain-containing diguanylate cyclase [Clostridium hydrogeniformans]|uniref:sensor domain-containing diguanylate cyclase n=1 Tax=Clostridium hydrogeniformans TaxID=349933 RepID=UPI0004801425|nr:sensor domain-containing diguanylate cyclase [Clostridium hydrogeniformans]